MATTPHHDAAVDRHERDLSLTVLVGRVAREPEQRELPSGSTVMSFDVSCRVPDGRIESVPVAWTDPPAKAAVRAGELVAVLGRTRRRFFRVAGATASRTEILAERVVPARRAQRFEATLVDAADRALAPLGPVDGG